jgi:hypothetical protein
MMMRCALLCVMLFAPALPAQAGEIYRWTDEAGAVHYGDRPVGAGAQKMAPAPAPAIDPDMQRRRSYQRRLLNAYEEERDMARDEQARMRREESLRREKCRLAREMLRGYTEAAAVYTSDDAGRRIALSDTERETVTDAARRDVSRWCE